MIKTTETRNKVEAQRKSASGVNHLGNNRLSFMRNAGTVAIVKETNYYPFGLTHQGYNNLTSSLGSAGAKKYQYNGKELQDDYGLEWYDYGARFYDASLGRWFVPDPMAEKYYSNSPYHFSGNDPVRFLDANGMDYDWVENRYGQIYWDNNATSQATTKSGEIYLGKNILVGTDNRDVNGDEAINSARFDLYLESDKTGPTATIYGNTVPYNTTVDQDRYGNSLPESTNKYGTLSTGLYPAKYTKHKGDGAILINNGGDVPTVNGNQNNLKNYTSKNKLKPIYQHVLDGIYFHKGNTARKSLVTLSGSPISSGCQTGGCGKGSLSKYRTFIKSAQKFNGKYYLRAKSLKPIPFTSEIKGLNY